MSEIVPWKPGDAPVVVRRAEEMAGAAALMRARREAAWLATPLPQAEADEVLILIFHREFAVAHPGSADKKRRYTYVANWRHSEERGGLWYLSHDATVRKHRAYTSRDLLLFARPIGPPVLLASSAGQYDPMPLVRVSTWFLPTQADR